MSKQRKPPVEDPRLSDEVLEELIDQHDRGVDPCVEAWPCRVLRAAAEAWAYRELKRRARHSERN